MGAVLGDLSFVYHPDYRVGVPGVPMDPMRGERILTFLLEEGWVHPREVRHPEGASLEDLRRVHSGEYLRSLDRGETVAAAMGLTLDDREARAAVELQRRMVGGTMTAAAQAVQSRSVAIHLGGGLHHAGPERGTGFCLLNDVAVAVARLRSEGLEGPVLIVDLDLHDGNGTRAAFAHDPSVHTFSLHNETWDEHPEAVADTCIAFGAGIGDDDYLELLAETLPPVVADHRPGFVVYLAGVDTVEGDSFGDGRMTDNGVLSRDQFVVQTIQERCGRIPMTVVLAGGYGAGAWRPSALFIGWLASGRDPSLPDDLTVALDRTRWLPREGEEDSPDDPFDWRLEASDLVGLGAGTEGDRLLLGRYSRRQVAESLDRFGVLDQARARGYREPWVEILPSSGLGPTVRLWGDAAREELLMELRLDLDRSSIPEQTLLKIEWLLLQDPRRSFPPGRRPLPGQQHPGLGGLADVIAWLVTLCREWDLDGFAFRSSLFHIAVLARRHLRFLDPEDRARFQALRRATQGLSLAEAARAVEEGRVVDEETGEAIRWTDVIMAVPVSPRLERVLKDAEEQEPTLSPHSVRLVARGDLTPGGDPDPG
jgi:acetoin utilization deacetylase AcuC-like enzyme